MKPMTVNEILLLHTNKIPEGIFNETLRFISGELDTLNLPDPIPEEFKGYVDSLCYTFTVLLTLAKGGVVTTKLQFEADRDQDTFYQGTKVGRNTAITEALKIVDLMEKEGQFNYVETYDELYKHILELKEK